MQWARALADVDAAQCRGVFEPVALGEGVQQGELSREFGLGSKQADARPGAAEVHQLRSPLTLHVLRSGRCGASNAMTQVTPAVAA